MIRLSVDGRTAEVEPGSTVLQAAKSVGIDIPTLCHLDGVSSSTSCFVCVVEVGGRRGLLPACALPAEEGMVALTDTPAVREARVRAVELLLSDHVGDCEAPCHVACPVGLDIPEYIRALRRDGAAAAARLMSAQTAFARSLARICPAFCERACRRRLRDCPVAIRALGRFIADAGETPARDKPTGKRVAIVGAGPCGLTAAYHLLRMGHDCVVLDANPEPGGLLRYGVPEFRLPKQALARDIEAILRLGAEFRPGSVLGLDISLQELRRDYDAVVLAFGAANHTRIGFHGEELATDGMRFVGDANAGGAAASESRRVVVGPLETGLDVAEIAARLPGETWFLAVDAPGRTTSPRVEQVRQEGVVVEESVTVEFLERALGRRLKLAYQCGGVDKDIETDEVIVARSREPDTKLIRSQGLQVLRRRLRVDGATMGTSLPGVFGGGEAVRGGDYAARAVADGRLVAASVSRFLAGEEPAPGVRRFNTTMRNLESDELEAFFAKGSSAKRGDEVETSVSVDDALVEAGRCLSCDCGKKAQCSLRALAERLGARAYRYRGERRRYERIETHPDVIYEPGKCVSCGRCVAITRQAGEEYGLAFIGRGFRVRVDAPLSSGLAAALTKTAAACVEACPTGALCFRAAPPAIGRADA